MYRRYDVILGGYQETPCDCCSDVTKTVNGHIGEQGQLCAVYLVRWTIGKVAEYGARYELVIGPWGDGTTAAHRFVVRFDYRAAREGRGDIVFVDADDAFCIPKLATVGKKRAMVIGQTLADEVFAMYDAIVQGDARLAELQER